MAARDRSAPRVGGLHLQYGADASTEVVVSWHTAGAVSNPGSWSARPRTGSARGPRPTRSTYRDAASGTEVRVHHARLTGLAPDTDYVYAAVHDGADPESVPCTPHRAAGPRALHQLRRSVHPHTGRARSPPRSARTTADHPRLATSRPPSSAPPVVPSGERRPVLRQPVAATGSGRGRTGSRTTPGRRATGPGCPRRETTRTSSATARSATAPTRPISRCPIPDPIRSCAASGTRSPPGRSG